MKVMDRLPGATSLARAFLALRRAEAVGVLEVRSGQRCARVAIVDGTPRAVTPVPGAADSLGDLLAADASFDHAAHRRGLDAGGPRRRKVGRWLVDTGAASEQAVANALRVQLRRRVVRLFHWHDTLYCFRAGSSDIGCPHVADPVSPEELVLSAMRAVVAQEPLESVRRRLGTGRLELTDLGEALVSHAPLWPAESAMVPLLRGGTTVERLISVTGGAGRALRALWALRLLGAAKPPGAGRRSYQLLMRKRRELRGSASNARLLDMKPGASPTSARRALRVLAKDLHPDRFASEALKRSSGEVLKALVRAEAEVRGN